jgi:hypothetical protein
VIREVHDDVLAILVAAQLRAYATGEVPQEPTYPYVTLHVQRRGVGANVDRNRASDHLALVGWRILTEHVSNYASGAMWMHDKVREVLEDRRLTIDGAETTPLHYETGTTIGPDDNIEDLYLSTANWTCVSTALQPA